MISNVLLVLGVAVLSAALRTVHHPVFRRLSTLGIVSTSFLAGWLLGGSVWLGAALAASWLFLIRALHDAGMNLQTGSLGWWALLRGERPRYPALPTGGVFQACRQPIYLAFFLILWTAPTWTPDHLILALAWTPYCLLAPRLKEHSSLSVPAHTGSSTCSAPSRSPATKRRSASARAASKRLGAGARATGEALVGDGSAAAAVPDHARPARRTLGEHARISLAARHATEPSCCPRRRRVASTAAPREAREASVAGSF